MHARHYSPALGRFLQPDPSDAEANLYVYATGNPISRVDPSGNCTLYLIWIPYVGPAVSAATCGYAALIAAGAGIGLVIGWAITNVQIKDNRAAGLRAEALAFRTQIWKPGRFYAFHVWFPTRLGSRYQDVCEWNSNWHYFGRRFHPNRCREVKSGGASYWGTRQHRKDIEIMNTFGFRIHLLRAPGIMEWPLD